MDHASFVTAELTVVLGTLGARMIGEPTQRSRRTAALRDVQPREPARHPVKDLVAVSGLTFEDAGEHELTGVPGSWHVYAAA